MSRDRVRDILESLGVQYAVGAIAVAARGAPRSTFDFDLLTTARRVLDASVWRPLRDEGTAVEIHTGELDDPLAGVVRIGAALNQIDIVVGKWNWQQRVIERAELMEVEGFPMRVPITSDLILLKLDAGGPIDQQDIIRLLAVGPREQLIAEVDGKIAELDEAAGELWRKLVTP